MVPLWVAGFAMVAIGCENVTSNLWWHHRFVSVAFAWFYLYLVVCNGICAMWMVFALMATSIAYG